MDNSRAMSPASNSSPSRPNRPRQVSSTLIDIGPPSTHSASPLIIPISPNGSMRSGVSSHSLTPLGPHPCGVEQPSDPRPYRDYPDRPAHRHTYSGTSIPSEDEELPILTEGGPGSAKWYQGPLFMTGVKLTVLFTLFSALVLGTFYFGLPKVEPEDRPAIKLPRNFADLQALNALLKKYKDMYPWRICLCFVVAYLYVQAFTLPGSMYLSILFGAAYGIIPGILLSCLCESCGSVLCYTLSAILAPPLLELPYYRKMLDKWRTKIMGDPTKGQAVGTDSVFTILLVLRILPFPPHWCANFVCPHLGIGLPLFWLSCFIGIAPVSVIHCMIGSSLDQMTSADDFKILSPRNIIGLGAVIVAVLIPVGLKRVFSTDLGDLGEEINETNIEVIDTNIEVIDDIPAPVPVEFDEHGLPRRNQAVDSGVDLAGPSAGDPNLDIDPRAHSKSRARKGPRAWFLEDEDDASPSGSSYEMRDPNEPAQAQSKFFAFNFNPFKAAREYNPLRSYGTITLDNVDHGSSSWWRFGRSSGGEIQI